MMNSTSTEDIARKQIPVRDIHLVPDAGVWLRGTVRHADRLGFIEGMTVSVVNLSSFYSEAHTTGPGVISASAFNPMRSSRCSSKGGLLQHERSGELHRHAPGHHRPERRPRPELRPGGAGRTDPLKHLRWAQGSADIDRIGKTELDQLVERLMVNPTLRIEVAVHSDSRGDAATDRKITQQRADAIRPT